MKVALVGFNNSESDFALTNDLLASGYMPYGYGLKVDCIDLSMGRDFLKEGERYDLVVLNYIFRADGIDPTKGPHPILQEYINELRPNDPYFFKVSTNHTKDNWRRRLLATKAETILTFGGNAYSEVDGEWLGELPGYHRHQEILTGDGIAWQYTRLP